MRNSDTMSHFHAPICRARQISYYWRHHKTANIQIFFSSLPSEKRRERKEKEKPQHIFSHKEIRAVHQFKLRRWQRAILWSISIGGMMAKTGRSISNMSTNRPTSSIFTIISVRKRMAKELPNSIRIPTWRMMTCAHHRPAFVNHLSYSCPNDRKSPYRGFLWPVGNDDKRIWFLQGLGANSCKCRNQ